jgi:NarL family two-component system sensor histidine kinase LiaS
MDGHVQAPSAAVTEQGQWIESSVLPIEAAKLQDCARLQERQRIARALHDTLAQMLFIIGLEAKWCVDHLPLDEEARRCMRKILRLAGRSSDELRTAIFALRSRYLPGSQGLAELLQEQVAEFQAQSGVAATLILPTDFPRLPPLAGEAVYRIVRESLSNVYKHARASAVVVSLHCNDRAVVITIQDDGVGLAGPLPTGVDDDDLHFGVSTMHQFTAQAQGALTIANNDDRGTTVRARFPLPARDGP